MLARHHKSMGYNDLVGSSFVEGTFDDPHISFYEAIGLGVMTAGSCVLRTIFLSDSVPFFVAERLNIIEELGELPLKTNTSLG